MLGAVAAGALLGAARGTYTINLDNQEADGGTPGERTDDEYKVVTTEGLEIVIGPSASSVYDIAPALPNPDNGLLLSIAVEGGDNQVPNVAGSCPGGIALDASTGDIFCYGVQRDAVPLVTNTGGSLTVANAENNVAEPAFGAWWDFADCPGDIDFDVINDEITCYDVPSGGVPNDANARGAALVTNTGGSITATANGKTFDTTNCPGGIVQTADAQGTDKLICYDDNDQGDDRGEENYSESAASPVSVQDGTNTA